MAHVKQLYDRHFPVLDVKYRYDKSSLLRRPRVSTALSGGKITCTRSFLKTVLRKTNLIVLCIVTFLIKKSLVHHLIFFQKIFKIPSSTTAPSQIARKMSYHYPGIVFY